MQNMSKFFIWVALAGLLLLNVILNARVTMLEAEVKSLWLRHKDSSIENMFLGRKLGELYAIADSRLTFQECQTDLAVAGFHMGHYRAAEFRRQGGFKSCNAIRENDIEQRRTTAYAEAE